ncbi:MAG: RNA-directed polymerase [Frondihabitans sp.]|nr:RNA-directed polymerase [Frondihabitans sp.]
MPSSPGLPRGTKIDQGQTPQEPDRAARGPAPAPTDESPGSRSHLAPHWGAPSSTEIAGALADAFLACDEWTAAGLRRAGADCLGSRRRFLRSVVDVVLETHHRPPRDAPRELAGLVGRAPGFADAVERARKRQPVRIERRVAVATLARPESTRILRLDALPDLARALGVDLAHLDWFADTGHWNRRATASALHHYRYEWRLRPGRAPRLLEVPGQRLRTLQRIVLDEILALLPLHDAAHGFVAGHSVATGAALHTGHDVVLSLDLVAFFARVTAKRVYSVLRQAGYPEPVAYSLTGLCTNVVPARVLSAMPHGGTSDERFRLRQALASPHLPQGSPTSPALANLTARRLDSRLAGWAEKTGATYTRYADDLAFSGDRPFANRVDAFARGVERIVRDEGHELNPRKTRVRRRSVRQTVTGVVVNERTTVSRHDYDLLRAILYNCARFGAASQNRSGHADFRSHLLGRIGWVAGVDAERGARLRREFARITW